MKRYIKCSNQYDSIHEEIRKVFGRSNPGPGCSYIDTDGTFIQIYPKLEVHEDLCEWIEDQFDIELPYRDEEWAIREFGWIRLRKDPRMLVIELPSTYPTKQQWWSLEEWLEKHELDYLASGVNLYIGVCDNNITDEEYNFGKEYFSEQIVKECKKCY